MDGVARKDRTSGLLVRTEPLFRLSYRDMEMASRAGFEPATYRVEAGRSVQLSYLDRWRCETDSNRHHQLRKLVSYPLDDRSRMALSGGVEPPCPGS